MFFLICGEYVQIQCGVLTCWCPELPSLSRLSCCCSPGQEPSPWTSPKCKSQLLLSHKCAHAKIISSYDVLSVSRANSISTPKVSFKFSTSSDFHVFGLCDEPNSSQKNPHIKNKYLENMQHHTESTKDENPSHDLGKVFYKP